MPALKNKKTLSRKKSKLHKVSSSSSSSSSVGKIVTEKAGQTVPLTCVTISARKVPVLKKDKVWIEKNILNQGNILLDQAYEIQSSQVEVKYSPKEGKGLFAKVTLEKGLSIPYLGTEMKGRSRTGPYTIKSKYV